MWPFARKSTAANPAPWFLQWLRGDDPVSPGITVNAQSAERASAVYACVRVVSEDVAKLPLILYRRRADGGKDRADQHPLYALLHDKPNAWQTSFDFRQSLQRAIELKGNGYGWKEKDGRGRVIAIWPLHPDRVTVKVNPESYALFYEVRPAHWDPGGKTELLPKRDILHVAGPTDDGICGKSTIQCAREAIAIALGAEKHQSRQFTNGARLGGIIEHPGTLTQPAQDALLASFKKSFEGSDNAFKTALFAGGMKFHAVTMTNEDAQFLELRGAQTAEIARFFRIPPHKIADLSKATFSNIEHQALEYVTDSLMPRLVRLEQRLTQELLAEDEIAQGYFFEFLVDGLLRGDIKSRYEALAIARQNGVINANQWRALENMNPRDGKGAEYYWRPVNYTPDDAPPAPAPAKADGAAAAPPPPEPKKLNGQAHA